MNYETIILEMLSRIQSLEDEVKLLKQADSVEPILCNDDNRVSTKDISNFINNLKEAALDDGQPSLVLIANDIHKELGLKSKMPLVCNAMKQCMLSRDKVLFETASGYSSTLQIKYYLTEWEKLKIERERIDMLWNSIVNEFSTNPRNVRTQPTDNRKPKWFYVGAENNAVYVEKGRDTDNNSVIKGKRYLEKEKLGQMLELYERRKKGESVSITATATTQNQVYWYGIFAEMEL